MARLPVLMVLGLAACGAGGGTSSGATAPPAAPAGVLATAGSGEVSISWTAVPDATGYTVYWSTSPNVTTATGSAVQVTASPFLHGGLSNGATYHYIVTARNEAGESTPSAETSCVPSGDFDPPWAQVAPSSTVTIDYDSQLSEDDNGLRLRSAIFALAPGQRLEIGAGTWSMVPRLSLVLTGTATAPIWIAAKSGEKPVITRPNALQNTINIGSGGPARYLALEGLEIRGGDTAVKMYDCANVWIDRCHIHDCGGAGIAANSAHTEYLYITRNEIHDTAGTAEGLYLGANNSQWVMKHSVIARNHIHDCYGTQGDGIEIKQGSYDNWVVENVVHDCQYPCILLYGTDGNAPNVVERNICYNSGDNVMQVQGEAIVRNNLIMAGNNGFHTHDHQGTTRDLVFVHNTIINTGNATSLSSWGNRTGMVFANNVVYSQNGGSIRFTGGSGGVTVTGNVVYGSVTGTGSGYTTGTGLSDFAAVTWNATQRDATPTAGSAIVGAGAPAWSVADDLTGAARSGSLEAGCYDRK